MSADPDRYSRMERRDTIDWVFKAVVTTLLIFIIGFSIYLQIEVYSHQRTNATLLTQTRTAAVQAKNAATAAKAISKSLSAGNATVSQILMEAGQVSAQLLRGQQVSSVQIATLTAAVTALCQAIPACRSS